jgi:hypothetical protein
MDEQFETQAGFDAVNKYEKMRIGTEPTEDTKWFVITSYPYEGIDLEPFDDESEARTQFIQYCKEHEDVLLIKGTIVEQKGII